MPTNISENLMTRAILAVGLALSCWAGPLPAASADTPPTLVLRGQDNGGQDDVLRANALASYAGETVRLFRRESGTWIKIRERRLDERGNARFTVDDHDGSGTTRYLAKVRPQSEGLTPQRAVVRVR